MRYAVATLWAFALLACVGCGGEDDSSRSAAGTIKSAGPAGKVSQDIDASVEMVKFFLAHPMP